MVNAPFDGSYIALCWYSNGNETNDVGWDGHDVTYWLPLPEAPKEETEQLRELHAAD